MKPCIQVDLLVRGGGGFKAQDFVPVDDARDTASGGHYVGVRMMDDLVLSHV